MNPVKDRLLKAASLIESACDKLEGRQRAIKAASMLKEAGLLNEDQYEGKIKEFSALSSETVNAVTENLLGVTGGFGLPPKYASNLAKPVMNEGPKTPYSSEDRWGGWHSTVMSFNSLGG